LINFNRDVLVFDVEAQPVEEAHINVSDPDEREPRNQVAAPSIEQHSEVKDPEAESSYIVGEAVLAGEQVKKLSLWECRRTLALPLAVLPRLTKNLFMRDCPSDAGDRKREQQQRRSLMGE